MDMKEFTVNIRLERLPIGDTRINVADEVAAPTARAMAQSVSRDIEKLVESKIYETLLGVNPVDSDAVVTAHVSVNVGTVVKSLDDKKDPEASS